MKLLLILALCLSSGLSFSPRAARNGICTSKWLFGNPEPPKTPPAKKDGGGLFGGMGGGMMDKMKQAQEIMKKAEEVNRELQETMIMGQDKDGQVFATFNGMAMPVGLKISESALAQGSEAVSLAATQAMIEAHAKAQQTMMKKMQSMCKLHLVTHMTPPATPACFPHFPVLHCTPLVDGGMMPGGGLPGM